MLLALSASCLERYTQKTSEEAPVIRKADLENHNKDGGLWVVIRGRVYDIHSFQMQTPRGSEWLLEHAGQCWSASDHLS